MKLGAIILAAGASSRMGQPKLLLPWGNTTVLGHLVALWRQLQPAQAAVVIAPNNAPLAGELDRLAWPLSERIVNPTPHHGMFSSIQCAARWDGWQMGLTHWAIVIGDQPLVRLETLQQFLAFAAQKPEHVSQPSRNGRGRHPVVLPVNAFRPLAASSAESLKQYLLGNVFPLARWESEDPGLDLDLDLPADYQRALALSRINDSRETTQP